MDSYEEKIGLLSEMIAFAVIDGELHDREYDFLLLVSQELNVEKDTFMDLFSRRNEFVVVKDEFHRILHFYRLALLMHCDGVLHERERIAINEIGINMGLNPSAMKRILALMESSPNKMIDPKVVVGAFQEQHN
ncbi:excinuclease ABC subunit B [Flavobacterium humi]|uniref:Excinuclease ABC subunit B n=1 Tax=Flavobacterium humi TaxID=2562683 RepID=A0A4Z0L955_9FLAO|nr:excinuclease ABC subunit B [Flavobacterium humi]TGD59074.1 excinuclease ABC subunit B [Flavobacterium humi]